MRIWSRTVRRRLPLQGPIALLMGCLLCVTCPAWASSGDDDLTFLSSILRNPDISTSTRTDAAVRLLRLGGPGANDLLAESLRSGDPHQIEAVTRALSENGSPAPVVAEALVASFADPPPGHGALAQRLLATRSPRDGALALAWFTIAHYVLRPWPWIIVALASIVLVPATFDPVEGTWVASMPDKDAFPWMIRNHLGAGFRGLLVVAMLGAFMSTVDTHVNLSSAYLLNDVLRPARRLFRREAEPPSGSGDAGGAGEVWKARALAIPVLVLVLLVASGFDDIIKLYKYLGVIAAGTAPVLILRWYWWRTTAWSEIAAMGASLVAGNLLVRYGPLAVPSEGADDLFGPRLVAVTILSAAVWIPATMLSRPAGDERLIRFLATVQPGGPGWRAFARRVGEPDPRGILAPMLWAAVGTCGIWMAIVGIGWLLLGRPADGLLMVLGAAVLGVPTIRAAARLGSR